MIKIDPSAEYFPLKNESLRLMAWIKILKKKTKKRKIQIENLFFSIEAKLNGIHPRWNRTLLKNVAQDIAKVKQHKNLRSDKASNGDAQ